jgi:hypothetical protein
MAEVQSLLVPNDDSKVQRLRAEVQLLRFRRCDGTVVTGYSRSTVTAGSRCEVQLSRVTGAHRMMSTCVGKR